MIDIIPSLASADQLNLENQILSLGEAKRFHLDIEDGNFVPNITFGMKTIQAVALFANQDLDAHLMVSDPAIYIDALMGLGIKQIAVHAESCMYPAVFLTKIKREGGKAGLAFNCMTPVECALPFIDYLDYVLIMTAEPDGEEQLFNIHMLDKIAKARTILPKTISIMVDGGITVQYLPQVVSAGANEVILGRTIWNAENPNEEYNKLMEVANGTY